MSIICYFKIYIMCIVLLIINISIDVFCNVTAVDRYTFDITGNPNNVVSVLRDSVHDRTR